MNLHAFLEFIIINFALIFFSLSIVAHFHRLKSINFLDLVLKSSSLFFSFILLTQISLGAFGLLTYKNLLSLLFVLSLFFLFSPIKDSLKKLQVNYNTKELSPWQLLALPLFVIFFIRFINALLQIPLEYDNVAYHLPFVVEWFKTGDLMTPYYSAFASPIGYYPSNFELFDLWLLFPFKNDLLINLINFPIVVLAIACLYGLCRNFSFNKSVSSLVALLPFYMPVFLKQVGLPLVDLFFSLCFLLCIYFLQKIYKSPKSKALPLPLFAYFGLSLGLFMGTKYLGLVYGILLVPVLIHAAFYKRKKAKRSWIATSIAAGTGGDRFPRNL